MPKKVKVVNVNDNSTYADITEAVVEQETVENEIVEPEPTQPLEVSEPQPKAKARAKRVSKPKAVERTETVIEPEIELETIPEIIQTKPKPKRAAKVKTVETIPVVEQPVEKPKVVRKPRVKKEEPQTVVSAFPAFPARLSRTEKREALYHSLASGGLLQSFYLLDIKIKHPH